MVWNEVRLNSSCANMNANKYRFHSCKSVWKYDENTYLSTLHYEVKFYRNSFIENKFFDDNFPSRFPSKFTTSCSFRFRIIIEVFARNWVTFSCIISIDNMLCLIDLGIICIDLAHLCQHWWQNKILMPQIIVRIKSTTFNSNRACCGVCQHNGYANEMKIGIDWKCCWSNWLNVWLRCTFKFKFVENCVPVQYNCAVMAVLCHRFRFQFPPWSARPFNHSTLSKERFIQTIVAIKMHACVLCVRAWYYGNDLCVLGARSIVCLLLLFFLFVRAHSSDLWAHFAHGRCACALRECVRMRICLLIFVSL